MFDKTEAIGTWRCPHCGVTEALTASALMSHLACAPDENAARIKALEDELKKLAAEKSSLIKMAREAVPDYPWDPKHPLPLREAVWALIQSVEGLTLACDDLRKIIDERP